MVDPAAKPGNPWEAGSPLDIPRNPDGEFKFLRGERHFQEVRDQTWAMFINTSEKDKEKFNPGPKRFEISQSVARMWN